MKKTHNEQGRFLPGNQAARRTGIYSQRLPLKIRRTSQSMRLSLIHDLGPEEKNLTTAQLILIDKATALFQVTMAIEGYVREHGPFRGKRLDPVLAENYLAYVNQLRFILRDLGINKRAASEVDPLKFIRAYDEEKKEQK
jgi:hypothetical protein